MPIDPLPIWIYFLRYWSQAEWSMMVLIDCRGKIWNEEYRHSDLLLFYFSACNFSIIFIAICSIYLFLICSTILLAFGSIVSLDFGSIVLLTIVLLFAPFLLKGVLQYSWQFSSLPFCLFYGIILSILMVMFATLLKCALFCSRYAVKFLNYLLQISICYHMYWFMSCIFYISDLYILKMSFILLMVVSCAAHTRLKVEVQKRFCIHIYEHNHTISFYLFSDILEVLYLTLIRYALKVFLIYICVSSCLIVAFQFLRLYCFVEVSNWSVDSRFNNVGSNVPVAFNYVNNMFD